MHAMSFTYGRSLDGLPKIACMLFGITVHWNDNVWRLKKHVLALEKLEVSIHINTWLNSWEPCEKLFLWRRRFHH